LNLAATEWIDEYGLSWLQSTPKIKLLPEFDLRKPYPLNWDEQETLFKELPIHLANMALFKVNTGCREREVCSLRWEWEIAIPELGTSAFIVPGQNVKNRIDRLIVLNRVASSVIESVRGQHPEFVFSFRGKPIQRMNNSGWRVAKKSAGINNVRVHDLKPYIW
jgi:integrase